MAQAEQTQDADRFPQISGVRFNSIEINHTNRLLVGMAWALFLLAALVLLPPDEAQRISAQKSSRSRVHEPMERIAAKELTIVDAEGRPRMRLLADSKLPAFEMLTDKATVAVEITLDETNHPSIVLKNPDGGSTASLAVDPKGAHVKFDRPGGASSYLFLNNEGVSGVVLLDKDGRRRYELLLNADSSATVRRFDDAGKPLP